MKTPTTREIFEAMHAAPKAPAPISGPVLGGGAAGVKSVLFERVKEAREAGKRLGLVERIKAGGEVSEDTAETYAATTRRRINLDAPGGGRLMEGVSAASWHATRAALLWGAARAWHKAMRDQDAAQKAGDMAGAMTHARRALAATVAIEAVEAAGHADVIVAVVGEVAASTRMPLSAKGERLLDAVAAAGGVDETSDGAVVVDLDITTSNADQHCPIIH